MNKPTKQTPDVAVAAAVAIKPLWLWFVTVDKTGATSATFLCLALAN